jgi:hypothetical protein
MTTLVIEWDRDRLIVVSGKPSGSSVTVSQAFTVTRESQPTPEALGEDLRQALATAGVTSDTTTVVLPRSLVTLRRIALPKVSDNELPDMVRLQAVTRLTVPMESICMDFVPLPGHSDGRDVLLATAPIEQIAEIKKTLGAAGLELSGVHVSSFGIASALAHAGKVKTTGESIETVITLRTDLIELLMIRQRAVVFSHSGASWSSPEQIEQAVRAEVSRGRLAATEAIGSHTVRQVTLVGSADVTSVVPDQITKRLDDASIQRLDPLESIVQGSLANDLTPSDVLAAVGVIAGQQKGSVATVDLVNPRKAVEQPDNRRLKVIMAVGAVLLLSVGAWKWRDSTIADLQGKQGVIDADISAYKSALKDGEDEIEQDVAIQQWSEGNLDWLDEMSRIREIMGGTDRLLVRNINFSSGHGKTRGTITADCYARDRSDVQEFYRRLRDAGYEVVPKGIQSGSREPDYSTQFSLVLDLPLIESEEES